MLWVMIKNNFKLMIRSKWILGIMVFGPVLVIAALSSAFNSIMEINSKAESFTVGYSMAENSEYAPIINGLKNTQENNKIEFLPFPAEEKESKLKENAAQVFVMIEDNAYTIYSDDEHEAQAKITEYLFYQAFHAGESTMEIPTVEKEFVKIPTAINYYGKIEIVYFLWCSMVILSTVIVSERKNRIQERLKISPASNLTLYLAKVLPCFLAITAVITVSTVLSTIIFDIEWGCIVQTALLLMLGAAAVSAVAVVLFYLITNVAVAVIVEFVVIWTFGFLGGSFESYVYSAVPEWAKQLSPIYHLNRVLVEYETNGWSAYTWSTVLFYLGIILVALVLGSFLMKRKMEER